MIILKSINPIEINKSPSKEMLQFADKWMNSPLLVELKTHLSKLFKIPEAGFDLTPYIDKNFDEIDVFNKGFFEAISIGLPDSLMHKYNLSGDWKKNLLMTIYFNAVVDMEINPGFLDQLPITFAVGKKAITNKLFDFEKNEEVFGLLMPFHTSKNQVHKWIDNHWEEVETAMDSHLDQKVPMLKHLKNWQIGQEIDQLKQSGLTYEQISHELEVKYPNNQNLLDYSQVKIIHHRYLDSKKQSDQSIQRLLSTIGNK